MRLFNYTDDNQHTGNWGSLLGHNLGYNNFVSLKPKGEILVKQYADPLKGQNNNNINMLDTTQYVNTLYFTCENIIMTIIQYSTFINRILWLAIKVILSINILSLLFYKLAEFLLLYRKGIETKQNSLC